MNDKTIGEVLSNVQFTLTVNQQELQVISDALVELPYRISSPVLAKCQAQINEQMAALRGKDAADEKEKEDEKDTDTDNPDNPDKPN